MNQRFILGMFLCLMFVASVSATTYQENADNIVFSGYPAIVDQSNMVDGDWDTWGRQGFWTGGHGYMDISLTYNIPDGVTSATWIVKDGEGTENLEIPEDCFDGGELDLTISTKSNFEQPPSYATIEWKCGEDILRTLTQDSTEHIKVYEEAVEWGEVDENATNGEDNPEGCDYMLGDTIDLPQITTELLPIDEQTHKLYLACLYSFPNGETGYESMTTQNCQSETQSFTPESAGDYNYNIAIAYRERQWNQQTGQWETMDEGIDNQLEETYTVCSIPDDEEGFFSFISWIQGILCSVFGWFC